MKFLSRGDLPAPVLVAVDEITKLLKLFCFAALEQRPDVLLEVFYIFQFGDAVPACLPPRCNISYSRERFFHVLQKRQIFFSRVEPNTK